ncbi:SMI1/KNR4 family protein [Streptomyces sp. NPDC003863]
MSDASFDWREFLGRWQDEWIPRADEDGGEAAVPLGAPGADETAIVTAEERLGRRLPPSYREFLAASDGWQVDQLAAVYRLGGVADVDWFGDPHDMASLYEEGLDDDPREEDVLLAGMWRRALRLDTESDASYALLDPGDSDADGEWALYVYKGWSGETPDRHPSFRAYMEAVYRAFHADRAERPDFVNATTRAQDARVEEARRLSLRGRYEEALPLLDEARSFGRPWSGVLLHQVRHLLAPGSEGLAAQALEQVGGAGAQSEGEHWDRAVAEAREAARWGPNDAAWRMLRDALPRWEAPGPWLIAPVGLLADPLLGPMITPERGREILATPRAGESGSAPEPVPDLDPPGLAWLTDRPGNREPFDGYRCVWAEGTDPARLPSLIGEDGAELSEPTDPLRASWRAPKPHEREGVELWEDRAVVAVGRTEEGWAFAFDGYSRHSLNTLFRSPAVDASASGRAVVVWCDPRRPTPDEHPVAFHLSVAEHGEELYSFTVRGTEIQRSGALPEALDPDRLFRPEDRGTDGERRALQALHTTLGLSLPRLALTRGRLHTFTTRSWTRAPGADEGYAYLTFVRHRP